MVLVISGALLMNLAGCSDDETKPEFSTDPEMGKPQEPDETSDVCTTYRQFVENSAENVLHDFSYAGYEHAEKAPVEADTWIADGYSVYNECDNLFSRRRILLAK